MLKFDNVYEDVAVAVKIIDSTKIFKFFLPNNTRQKDIGNRISNAMKLNPITTEYEFHFGWPVNPLSDTQISSLYTLKQCKLNKDGQQAAKLIKTIDIDHFQNVVGDSLLSRNIKSKKIALESLNKFSQQNQKYSTSTNQKKKI